MDSPTRSHLNSTPQDKQLKVLPVHGNVTRLQGKVQRLSSPVRGRTTDVTTISPSRPTVQRLQDNANSYYGLKWYRNSCCSDALFHIMYYTFHFYLTSQDLRLHFEQDFPEINRVFTTLAGRRGPTSSSQWRQFVYSPETSYILGVFHGATDMFKTLFGQDTQTFFKYTFSADYKCSLLHCPNYERLTTGQVIDTVVSFPSKRGVYNLTDSLVHQCKASCSQIPYRCNVCDTRVQVKNIFAINRISTPKMLCINLQNFYNFNATSIRTHYNGQIQSPILIDNVTYKLVGAVYFANSHYCTLLKYPDSTIHEYDGMVKRGKVRQTGLTDMPYTFDFRQDTPEPKTFTVELAVYVASTNT